MVIQAVAMKTSQWLCVLHSEAVLPNARIDRCDAAVLVGRSTTVHHCGPRHRDPDVMHVLLHGRGPQLVPPLSDDTWRLQVAVGLDGLAGHPWVVQRLVGSVSLLGVDLQQALQQVLGGCGQVVGPLGEAQSELLPRSALVGDLAAVVIEGQTAAKQHEHDDPQ